VSAPGGYLVEADGGSRGNPGPAGYGAVVRDPATGGVLAERAEAIGRATNNVAEYRGLLAGLQAVLDLGGEGAPVEVRMDSKLVVEQMSGRWQVKHPDMKPLAARGRELVGQLGRVRFTWVPRAQNAEADALANAAMDAAARGESWQPSGGSREPLAERTEVPEPEPAPRAAAERRVLRGWTEDPTPPTTGWLVRHGRTPMSVEKRFSGVGDPELDEVGLAQADRVAARLGVLAERGPRPAAVVSSPLKRARVTAEAVARVLGLEVELEPGLRETDFGDWDGYTFAEVKAKWPDELAAWLASPDHAPPYGESFTATARRVAAARDRLVTAYRGQTVVCVSHVTPIKTLVRLALEAEPSALYRLHLDNASLSEVVWYDDGPAVLRLLNETAHLDGLERVPGA
jgi:broad specificity phosphatase PhoE/ribonuclease HI